MHFYYAAFFELSSCRSFGYGVEGPIWWTAQHAFCKEYKLKGEHRDDFYYHLAELDKAYLKYQAAKTKKDLAKKGTKGKGKKKISQKDEDG